MFAEPRASSISDQSHEKRYLYFGLNLLIWIILHLLLFPTTKHCDLFSLELVIEITVCVSKCVFPGATGSVQYVGSCDDQVAW